MNSACGQLEILHNNVIVNCFGKVIQKSSRISSPPQYDVCMFVYIHKFWGFWMNYKVA
jgi:hypothetical protein